MKILSIGNFGHGWDGSICDEEHIASALEELGHEVTRVQRGDGWDVAPDAEYDFTLVAQYDRYDYDFSLVPRPLVYWAFDYQADGQEWHERLVKEADVYLSKRIADSKYLNWQWLSQDFSPAFLDRLPEIEFINKATKPVGREDDRIDVLFTGSWLPWAGERVKTLQAVNSEFNLVVHTVNPHDWYQSFKDVREPIMDEGLPELYARAKVILSIDHTIEAGYWSDRNAQIMACGKKPLFRYVPFSESTFHDYVDYFYDVDDCLQKIQALLDNPSRDFSQDRSYEYAQANLKVKNRVQDLLTIVERML